MLLAGAFDRGKAAGSFVQSLPQSLGNGQFALPAAAFAAARRRTRAAPVLAVSSFVAFLVIDFAVVSLPSPQFGGGGGGGAGFRLFLDLLRFFCLQAFRISFLGLFDGLFGLAREFDYGFGLIFGLDYYFHFGRLQGRIFGVQ